MYRTINIAESKISYMYWVFKFDLGVKNEVAPIVRKVNLHPNIQIQNFEI